MDFSAGYSAAMPDSVVAAAPVQAAPKEIPSKILDEVDRRDTDHSDDDNDVAVPSGTGARRPMDEVDEYLWNIYQRSKIKRDSSGDFTWKDEAAAMHMGVTVKQYVIGGMDLDFRELLYALGHELESAGLYWTILSGFRDDYRQGLASGYHAHVGNSFHGGNVATGGYSHGCAVDINAVDGEASSAEAVWRWVDQHGEKFGIYRPMKTTDPAHLQPRGDWHNIALNLRGKRETTENRYVTANPSSGEVRTLVDTHAGVTEAQFNCVRSHHDPDFRQGGLHHLRFRRSVMVRGRMYRSGRRGMALDVPGRERQLQSLVVKTA